MPDPRTAWLQRSLPDAPVVVRALAFIPRSAGLAVHAVEEIKREAGWRHVPNDEIDYDGPPLRPLGRG